MFKTITLVLTNRCNLRCKYCYEEGKAIASLDFSTIKKIINQEIQDKDGYDEFVFDLFGGEPFMEFETIVSIYEYLCSIKIDLPWTVFITTNGTQLNPKIKQWLLDHKEKVICGLSMDGIKKVQDHDRSSSYDLVDYKFFAKTYPNQGVKMTVSKYGLNHLFESITHLISLGFNRIDSNLAYGIEWDPIADGKILVEQLNLLADWYIENKDIKADCRFLTEPLYLLGSDDGIFRTYCGSKHYLHLYDVDGKEYPCHLFMPTSVKERSMLIDEVDIPKEYMDMDRVSEECKECIYKRICHFCFGANYCKNGDIYKIDKGYCEMYKHVFKINAEFQSKLWELGEFKFADEEQEKAWILGVQKILYPESGCNDKI